MDSRWVSEDLGRPRLLRECTGVQARFRDALALLP